MAVSLKTGIDNACWSKNMHTFVFLGAGSTWYSVFIISKSNKVASLLQWDLLCLFCYYYLIFQFFNTIKIFSFLLEERIIWLDSLKTYIKDRQIFFSWSCTWTSAVSYVLSSFWSCSGQSSWWSSLTFPRRLPNTESVSSRI